MKKLLHGLMLNVWKAHADKGYDVKIKVQKNENSKPFIIEIPPVVHLSHVAPGEKFPVIIYHDHHPVEKMQACFLAERTSLLIGHQVVKIKSNTFLKNHVKFDL